MEAASIRRTNPKRVFRRSIAVAVVVAFAVLGLLAAEGFRVTTLRAHTKRLDLAIQQLETEVQQGRSAADYYRDRAQGSNGWKHLAEYWNLEQRLKDAGARDSEPVESLALFEVIEALTAYFWLSEDEEADEPDEAELARLLEVSQPIADAIKHAVECDVIAAVPEEGSDRIPFLSGESPFPARVGGGASFGRCKALIALGRASEAEQELLALAGFSLKFRPVFRLDALFRRTGQRPLYERALQWLKDGVISEHCAMELALLPMDPVQAARIDLESDAVWLSQVISRSSWYGGRHGWFTWLGEVGPDETMFAHFPADGMWDRATVPVTASHQVASTIENDLKLLRMLRKPPPWPELEEYLADDLDTLFGTPASKFVERLLHGMKAGQILVQLELEVLRQRNGELHNQREAVQAAVAKREYVTLRWEGETPVLGLRSLIGEGEAGPEYETEVSPD